MSIRKLLFLTFGVFLVAGLCLVVRIVCYQPATFRGHTGRIISVVASPDGKTLASTSEDGTMKLWDVDTRKERATLQGKYPVFSPDGKTLALIDTEDGAIRLWDAATGTVQTVLREDPDTISCFVFGPDGMTLAVGKSNGTVKLWDLATGVGQTAYQGTTLSISTVVFSPDGKSLALVSYDLDGTIRLWDLTAGKARATFQAQGGHVYCLAFSPDGKILASGDAAGMVKLWDVATGTNIAALDGRHHDLESVVFSSDGNALASLDIAGRINLWDVARRALITTSDKQTYRRPRPRLLRFLKERFPHMEEHRDCPCSVLFTPDGRKLMAVGYDDRDDSTVKMWQVGTVATGRR
jgi:predicted NACHT family NTPase